MEKFIPYSIGIVSMSVCVDKKLNRKKIEELANVYQPTGISSRWQISKDKKFHSGESMPCACDKFPKTRKHYLLNC